MNYNYSFSEKTNKLSVTASHKSTVINEAQADLIKTSIISGLNAINTEVLSLEKIGTTVTKTINVSNITTLEPVNEVHEVVWLSNPVLALTTTRNIGAFQYIIEYDGEIVFKKLLDTTETSIAASIQNSSPQSLKTYTFGYNANALNFFLKREYGEDFPFEPYKLKAYIFQSSGSEVSNIFNSYNIIQRVEPLPATSGLTLKIGETVIATYDTVIETPVDVAVIGSELDKLIANSFAGYTLSKTLKEDLTYDLTVSFEVTESNYLLSDKPITLSITNNRGSVTYEQSVI